MRNFLQRAANLPTAIGKDLQSFGGYLRCETCHTTAPLDNVGEKLSNGWPKCCGYTMRWWTQQQIDAGQVASR